MGQDLHGVWLVDKPQGATSHDVVARARRLLKTRQVGHAGTLDPMATGLLLLLIGEATKLSPFLTLERKRYRADIRLGIGTDSLDADGAVVSEHPPSDALLQALAAGPSSELLLRALEAERSRSEQVPPAVSAIHVDGERAHERVRRGEEVHLAPRSVQVFSLDLLATEVEPFPILRVELEVSKGYYVRSLGRDLGAALGVPAHLSALRRLRSGAFDVSEASPLQEPASLLSLEEATRRVLPVVALTEQGAWKARQGQALGPENFLEAPGPSTAAWLAEGRLVAIGEPREDGFRVVRGFRLT